MRRIFTMMPMILLAAGLPAHSSQPNPSTPGPAHRIHVYRAGRGELRVREAAASRTAVPCAPGQVRDTGLTHPYQVSKPGEGAPKG